MGVERVLRRGASAWAHAAAGLAIPAIFGWLAIRDVSWGSVRVSLEHVRAAWLIGRRMAARPASALHLPAPRVHACPLLLAALLLAVAGAAVGAAPGCGRCVRAETLTLAAAGLLLPLTAGTP